MEPRYTGQDALPYQTSTSISMSNIVHTGNQSVGNMPPGSRFAAYRDTTFREVRVGGGSGPPIFTTPLSSPHLKPAILQLPHQIPSSHPQQHSQHFQSASIGQGGRTAPQGGSSIAYSVDITNSSISGEHYAGPPAANRIRSPPQSEVSSHYPTQRIYGRDERSTEGSNQYGTSSSTAYATTSRTISITPLQPLPTADPSNGNKPSTPRKLEQDNERHASRSTDKGTVEPRNSSDFVRQPAMSSEHERPRTVQIPTVQIQGEELTNLLKERDRIRTQAQQTQPTDLSKYSSQDKKVPQQAQPSEQPKFSPQDVRVEISRQNIEVMKERDLLRSQFEELTNRYQLLQHSLKALEEQSSKEHGTLELTTKKLKDAEANASSLQNHQTMLARENQLLKEQLGKVLRLHESEKAILQTQLQNFDGQLSTARAEAAEYREKSLRISEQVHANQAKNVSQEEMLRSTTYILNKIERTLFKTAVVFNSKKKVCSTFGAWKDLYLDRKHRAVELNLKHKRKVLNNSLEDWSFLCNTKKIENMKAAHEVEVNSLRKELVELKERMKIEAEEADTQYRQLHLRYDQERKALQMETETLAALRAEMGSKSAETEAAWSRKLEEARLSHEIEVSHLTSRFEQLQSELCEKLVNSRTSSLEQLETLRAEQSRNEREWRQKIIDKEKLLATHLEDIEKQRMRSIEEVQQELQAKEKEWMSQMDALRAENLKLQEDWRQKTISKEKEFAAKMEVTRESHIRAQEDFQAELQEKEREFKRVLESKEQEFQSMIDSRVSSASGSAMKLLQSRLALQEATVRERDTQIQVLRGEKIKLQEQIEIFHSREQSLLSEIEDLRNSVKTNNVGSAGDVSNWITKIAQLEASLQATERNFNVEKQKASTLSIELEAASQTLIKRGEEYSSTVRMLQGRVDAKEIEISTLKDKLTSASAPFVAELASLKTTTDHDIQKRISILEEENRKIHQDWQSRFVELQNSSQMEISGLKSQLILQSPNIYETDSTQRLLDLEGELEQLRKFLGSIQLENTTLTNELDNVLLENAQLRQKLDSGNFNDEQKDRQSASYVPLLHKHSVHSSSRSADGFPASGSTCGVHTTRLKRDAFEGWLGAILEVRMWGKNHSFNCLDYFLSMDGTPAEWLPVGKVRKGDFEIKGEKIGSGTFAEVLRGEMKIPCAIKRIKGTVQQKEILEFVREGEMMRSINHPNVVRLIGVQAEQGQYHLLQEYVCGFNLFDYLHKYHKTVPIGKQFGIAVQICDALIHIHDMRIVHRDVKTQNMIYVEKTGVVKLCDFGLARLMPFGISAIDPKHLGTGGTPAYQGPEVLKRHPVGLKLDLYGFAISLWEMYTAKLPWSDCSLDQMTVRVAVQKERPRIPTDMPRDYAEIICQCWHDDPNARPNFRDIFRPLIDLHDSLNPNSRLTMSASSIASTIAVSNGSAEPYSTRSAALSQQGQRSAAAAGQVQQPQRFTTTIAQF